MTLFKQFHITLERLLRRFTPRNDRYMRKDCFVVSLLAMTGT